MPLRLLSSLDPAARRPDVAIIGSGIVGLATAFFCAREGLRVLMLERMRVPTALTSRRSGEGVRAQWELPHNIAIARESIDFYANFAGHLGDERYDAGYRPIGYLYASRTAEGAAMLAARVERQRAAGLDDIEYLGGEALRSRAPLLAPDVVGGAIRARDGVIAIDRVIAGYRETVDADLLAGVAVGAIVPGAHGVRIETTFGSIEAGAAVVAAGARAGGLLSAFPHAPKLRPARSTIVRVRTEGIPVDHPATIDTDIGSFWRPDDDGARITASFRGLLFIAEGVDDPAPDPDYIDHAIATAAPMTPRWAELAGKLIDHHVRSGTFAVTEDGAPVIGPVPAAPGVYANAGYGGHGVMMSPGGGRRMAAMLASGRHNENDPFAPARFLRATPPAIEPMTIHLNSLQEEKG